MKLQSAIALLTASALVLSVSACNSNSTSEKVTFSCSTSNGVPTTVAKTSHRITPVIRWVSDFGGEVGYTPQKRCEEVSNRFQQYYNQGVLNFVTTGRENNQNIICVSSEKGGACQGLLFTLKPSDNPSLVIGQMFEVAGYASGPLDQSSSSGIYIDINELLGTSPREKN
jgi:hypothetical protein